MKDRQITEGHRDRYAELGVENPRDAFHRMTGDAFTSDHHEQLTSLAALARLLDLYTKLGDRFESYQPLLDDLQRLHDDLEAYSTSEEWRRTWALVQRDRQCQRPFVDLVRMKEDSFASFWSNAVLDQLTPDDPASFMSGLREHIQHIQALASLFVKLPGKKGAPVNVERYILVIASDLLARNGHLPRELTPRELALLAEDVGLEELPKLDVSDAAGNIAEARERLAMQWKETASSARGRKATKLSRKCSGVMQALEVAAADLLELHGLDVPGSRPGDER